MPRTAPLVIMALLAAGAAKAADPAGSNIALTDYPGPSCTRPQLPVQPQMPPNIDAPGAADRYNSKVAQYNKDIAGYNSAIADFGACMRAYVDNGNADMQRIKQKLDEAVAEANTH